MRVYTVMTSFNSTALLCNTSDHVISFHERCKMLLNSRIKRDRTTGRTTAVLTLRTFGGRPFTAFQQLHGFFISKKLNPNENGTQNSESNEANFLFFILFLWYVSRYDSDRPFQFLQNALSKAFPSLIVLLLSEIKKWTHRYRDIY